MKEQKTHIFFVGIGGIGMSALARYFKHEGKQVAGYDKTSSSLSKKLEAEGIPVIYEDSMEKVDPAFLDNVHTKVIYTPAVPSNTKLYKYFKENNFEFIKRAKALGEISKEYTCIAVAGTHGKTTISSLIAHLLHSCEVPVNALLGGIALNFNSNFLWNTNARILVTEADEYDQSFLQLHPNYAVISSVDADHLDIYGEESHVLESFQAFSQNIEENGKLITKANLQKHFILPENTEILSYSFGEKTDYSAINVHVSKGKYVFDLTSPSGKIEEMTCGLPGRHNVENAVAALAVCMEMKVEPKKLKEALESFQGVQRRFDIHYHQGNKVYIDDYAHHPAELNVLIRSVKELFPQLKITGIFQPHLYSRTRDFMDDFAESLSELDELILLDIYAAREEPLQGITSEMLLDKVSCEKKEISSMEDLIALLQKRDLEVLLSIGAGNIDSMVEPIKEMLNKS